MTPQTETPTPEPETEEAQDAKGGCLQQACSGEVVHGFMLPPGQDASGCVWWPEFVEYFERVEGFTPHPRDTHHKRLFEYFVEGAFRQHEQSQNDALCHPADGDGGAQKGLSK